MGQGPGGMTECFTVGQRLLQLAGIVRGVPSSVVCSTSESHAGLTMGSYQMLISLPSCTPLSQRTPGPRGSR